MSHPPLVLFAPTADPDGVLRLLEEVGTVRLTMDGDTWIQAELTWSTGASDRHRLTVSHSPDYYAGPGGPDQQAGMKRYFASMGASARVQALLDTFAFSLSFPDATLPVDPTDPVHALLQRLATHLDGVWFLPGHLYEADGQVLVEPAPPPDDEGEDEDEDMPDPPTPARVMRRAQVLSALSYRALGELEAPEQAKPELRDRVWTWIESCGLTDELEEPERALLQSPERPGQQELINAAWRIEGVGVLCWALGLTELPPYDQLVSPPELWRAVGLFAEPQPVRQAASTATLLPPMELDEMSSHLLAFHWRMSDFGLNPEPMDFVGFSERSWFGGFDLDRFEVLEGDLALGGVSITEAGADAVSRASSTAMERHLAIRWLEGDSLVYSETDTST